MNCTLNFRTLDDNENIHAVLDPVGTNVLNPQSS